MTHTNRGSPVVCLQWGNARLRENGFGAAKSPASWAHQSDCTILAVSRTVNGSGTQVDASLMDERRISHLQHLTFWARYPGVEARKPSGGDYCETAVCRVVGGADASPVTSPAPTAMWLHTKAPMRGAQRNDRIGRRSNGHVNSMRTR